MQSGKSTRGSKDTSPDPGQSFGAIARRQFMRNRLAVAGLAVVFIFATIAVWCPLLATNKPFFIRTVFADQYENAYYSSLDLLARIDRLDYDRSSSMDPAAEIRAAGRLLDARLREMVSSLGGPKRQNLNEMRGYIRVEIRMFDVGLYPERNRPWSGWRTDLEALADPKTVKLSARTLFPAIRSLRSAEVFFIVLWIATVVIWSTGYWRRGVKSGLLALLLPAAAVAVVWRVANPPIADTNDYRALIERPQAAVAYLRAPVPYGENENLTRESNQPPTWMMERARRVDGQHTHWFGTDPSGRDVLTRMIYGTRISMLIGIVAVSIFVTIGILVGAIAGYFGGWIDIALSRVIEIVICFPTLFMLLILLAYIRPNIYTIMAALGLISWTSVARLERGEFLRLVSQDFVLAVRALGGGPARIIFRHILPNALGPVLVSASFGIAGSILAESTLSFLGFGVPPDKASWGGLLKIGNDNIQELWWMVVFPGVALFTTVTCFNLVGEGIRDATDPRLIQ